MSDTQLMNARVTGTQNANIEMLPTTATTEEGLFLIDQPSNSCRLKLQNAPVIVPNAYFGNETFPE